MPVVADCEIMCWPFWEYALLIWVCLVVYKKLTPPPPAPPHPLPHSHPSPPEKRAASFKSLFCRRMGWLVSGRLVSYASQCCGWGGVGGGRSEHEGSKPTTYHIYFLEFIFQKHLLGCPNRHVQRHFRQRYLYQ